jgi:hypothetical protein
MINLAVNYDQEYETDEVAKSSLDFYNRNENILMINKYKQFIREDHKMDILNEKIIKKCKKDFRLDYDKLKKNKYNIEIKNSINELNRKYLSTIHEIKCKDILI